MFSGVIITALSWLLGVCVTVDSDFLLCSVSGFFAVSGGGYGSRMAQPRARGRDGYSQRTCISNDRKAVVLSR